VNTSAVAVVMKGQNAEGNLYRLKLPPATTNYHIKNNPNPKKQE